MFKINSIKNGLSIFYFKYYPKNYYFITRKLEFTEERSFLSIENKYNGSKYYFLHNLKMKISEKI